MPQMCCRDALPVLDWDLGMVKGRWAVMMSGFYWEASNSFIVEMEALSSTLTRKD